MNLLEKADQLEERAAAMRAYIVGDPVEMLVTEPGEPRHPEWVPIIPQWAENKRYRVAQDPLANGHNPDRLTVSQVGEGWRLLDGDEVHPRGGKSFPAIYGWGKDAGRWDFGGNEGYNQSTTYKTRLSRSELAALDKPAWKLSRHIEGFRPLEDGEEWHRSDFTEDMLPSGWRPLLRGETYGVGDGWLTGGKWKTVEASHYRETPCDVDLLHSRTRRPLPVKDVPWDCADDVPGPVCWLRSTGSRECVYLISVIKPSGVWTANGAGNQLWTWRRLANGDVEHSTDRKTWKPCFKPAK